MDYRGAIVGLGNPGTKYDGSRHNTGFLFVNRLLKLAEEEGTVTAQNGGRFTCDLWRVKLDSLGGTWLVAKPLTFMNLSGNCVQPLLAWQYLDTCADYVIPLLPSRSYEANAGDGKRVAIDVDFDYNDEYGSYAREYVIGNTRIRPEGYSYSSDSYIVVAGGKHYLYTFSSAENDYSMLEVVDVDTKSLDESRTENAGLGGVDYTWDEGDSYDTSCLRGPAFIDPSDVTLSRRLEVLGTTNGFRSCHVGADGYPAANDELYTILTSFAIRAKKDLKLDVVDASGKKTGTKTVPAGTYLFDMRTDGETFVDLQTIDASALGINDESEWKYFQIADRSTDHINLTKPIYRVHIDHSDGWPYHVNGVEEDSLFEGIMYAG